MAIENWTINLTNFSSGMPTINIEQWREQDFIQRYCSKIEHGVYYYIAIYVLLTLILQLFYKFGRLNDAQFIRWSQSLHTSYLMISIVVLVQAYFRL